MLKRGDRPFIRVGKQSMRIHVRDLAVLPPAYVAMKPEDRQ
jgi:hypothetical protein